MPTYVRAQLAHRDETRPSHTSVVVAQERLYARVVHTGDGARSREQSCQSEWRLFDGEALGECDAREVVPFVFHATEYQSRLSADLRDFMG